MQRLFFYVSLYNLTLRCSIKDMGYEMLNMASRIQIINQVSESN